MSDRLAPIVLASLLVLLVGPSKVLAQYSPFQTSAWDGFWNCATSYTDGLSTCNSDVDACKAAQGPNGVQSCLDYGAYCYTQNEGNWFGCMANVSGDAPMDPYCPEARARRDACYQWMDYCYSLALDPEAQAICDEGPYYCTVTSGVSQCE